MPDPHSDAVRSATRTVEELGKLFDRLRAVRSPIRTAYRVVQNAMSNANIMEAADALSTLEAVISAIVPLELQKAVEVGIEQAVRDLQLYGLESPTALSDSILQPAIAAAMATVQLQSDRAMSLVALELGDEYVLGDENRLGVLRPGPVIGETLFWMTSLSLLAYTTSVSDRMGDDARRQAVAQIDSDTTQTCLNVHGQIVRMKQDFHLTGTPRYADDMHQPPFHKGCRTGVIIIPEDQIDDDVTRSMRREAIEQGKEPRPSSREGKAHNRVVGHTVQEFRNGRWHKFKKYDTIRAARLDAAKLNRDRRS